MEQISSVTIDISCHHYL